MIFTDAVVGRVRSGDNSTTYELPQEPTSSDAQRKSRLVELKILREIRVTEVADIMVSRAEPGSPTESVMEANNVIAIAKHTDHGRDQVPL